MTRFQRYFSTVSSIVRNYGVFIAATMLIGFGLFFLINGRAEISEAIGLIASISPAWIAALALLQALVLLIAAFTYQVLLRRQGHHVGIFRLLEVHFQRLVVGAVAPVGGPASIYVLMRSLRRNGVSESDSLILASIRSISGVFAFLLFLIPALLLQPPTTLVTIATAVLFVSMAATLWCSIFVLRTGELPGFLQQWAPQSILTFIDTARNHHLSARDFVSPTILAFFSHVLTAMMLFVGLAAVGYQATLSTVLIGYVVGKLFFMMAPVFQGIGIVELGMAIALQQAGVPAAVAVSGALLYRVGDLWLPLSWGFGVQLVRMPVMQHLREAKAQAGTMLRSAGASVREPWNAVSLRTVKLGRLALVIEAPLALTIGVLMAVAGGLPFVG